MNKAETGYINLTDTDVCISFTCCDELHHYDGYGMWLVQCPICKQEYKVSPDVKLIPKS